MNIFAKFGELILKLIDFIGILIINIPKIPQLIMNINTKEIRDKMDSAEIKENVTKITTNMNIAGFKEAYNNQKQTIQPTTKTVDSDAVYISGNFTSEEKESNNITSSNSRRRILSIFYTRNIQFHIINSFHHTRRINLNLHNIYAIY